MIRYILKRLIWLIPIMLGVLIIVFSITYLTPGDPVLNILGTDVTPESYAAKAKELGLDKGYFGQLITYIWKLITRFDLGKSFYSNIPVAREIATRFPISARIGLSGLCLAVLIGIPLGITSAVKQYSIMDYALTSIALIMAAIPGFVLSIICLVYLGVQLKWFPIAGLDTFKSWILPVASNAFPSIASLMRMTRTTMLEVIRQDYIRTARSKGLKENLIIVKHALKNCLMPLITVIGGAVAMVLGGSIIVENIFNIRGLGTYMYGGLMARDYPIINACVLMTSFLVCIVNLIVDILYAQIDPRIKAQYSTRKRADKRRERDEMTEEGVA